MAVQKSDCFAVAALPPATPTLVEEGAMVDYEKGNPSWDIGTILTRHASERAGSRQSCAKVGELLRSVYAGLTPEARLERAHRVECTCGAGDSPAEHTYERKMRQDAERAASTDGTRS